MLFFNRQWADHSGARSTKRGEQRTSRANGREEFDLGLGVGRDVRVVGVPVERLHERHVQSYTQVLAIEFGHAQGDSGRVGRHHRGDQGQQRSGHRGRVLCRSSKALFNLYLIPIVLFLIRILI